LPKSGKNGGRERSTDQGRRIEAAPGNRQMTLKLHDGLHTAESSLLVQMRIGKIGLLAFLFERRVPDVMTPACACGDGRETARHVAAYCQLEEATRRELPFTMRTHQDFEAAVRDPGQWALRNSPHLLKTVKTPYPVIPNIK
jgi:hypothetical protein